MIIITEREECSLEIRDNNRQNGKKFLRFGTRLRHKEKQERQKLINRRNYSQLVVVSILFHNLIIFSKYTILYFV